MDEFNKFSHHVDLGFNNQPFDHDFVIYYASKYYSFYLKNLLNYNNNNENKVIYYTIISKFLGINFSFLKNNINYKMFKIIRGFPPSEIRYFFNAIIKQDCILNNIEFLEATYPNAINFNECFKTSILSNRVDCYIYFKNRINIDTINDNTLVIKNIDILNDIFNNQYNLYNKINVHLTIQFNKFDYNVIHIIYMMGLLEKIDRFSHIREYFRYVYNNNISCEVMDRHIINMSDSFTNENIVELFSIFFNF